MRAGTAFPLRPRCAPESDSLWWWWLTFRVCIQEAYTINYFFDICQYVSYLSMQSTKFWWKYSWLSLSQTPSISNLSLSRTKVSVPLCRLSPIFLSLSRTLSISNKFSGPLRVRDRESQLYDITSYNKFGEGHVTYFAFYRSTFILLLKAVL